jgi:hypothetical protein
MRSIWIILVTLLFAIPVNAVVITCVNEGNGVVRIDYDSSGEKTLPRAFAMDISVDGGATITKVYDYKVGDSNSATPGFGIFPNSMQLDPNGGFIDWGSPIIGGGTGTSAVTLGMASRYYDTKNAPKVKGTLCRLFVDTHGAASVNINVTPNTNGGGVVLEDATVAKFSAVGSNLGGSPPPPAGLPPVPATIIYPASSSTGQYSISWPSSSGATSYQLERSNDAGGTWSQVYSGGNLTYSESVASGSYRYRVRATNTVGSSTPTTGTTDCVVSTTNLGVRVTKCTVAAGNKAATDSISVSGYIDSSADKFTIPGSVVVTISSADIVSPCVQTFPINGTTFKAGKYKCTLNPKPLKTSFAFDTKTSKFSFTAKNVSLKGLSSPVHIEIKIGDYTGAADIDETIVNGVNKPIPIKLLMGVKSSLRVDTITVKRSAKPRGGQLTVKGGFAVADTTVNMVNEALSITLGSQTFTIPAGKFKTGTGKFTCSKITLSDGSVAAASFNFNTCAFSLTIKNTTVTAGAGNVNLGVSFAGFNVVKQVDIK